MKCNQQRIENQQSKTWFFGENSSRQISTQNDQLEKQKDTNTVINVRRGHNR